MRAHAYQHTHAMRIRLYARYAHTPIRAWTHAPRDPEAARLPVYASIGICYSLLKLLFSFASADPVRYDSGTPARHRR